MHLSKQPHSLPVRRALSATCVQGVGTHLHERAALLQSQLYQVNSCQARNERQRQAARHTEHQVRQAAQVLEPTQLCASV